MNPARRSRTSALAALALLACCIAAPASAAQWALLVGVGDYPGAAFDLEGPAHDVAALRRELVENLGYPEAQVNVLVDANATRANILDALRRLARDAAPGDFVLVYLSGHGTSAYDPNRPVALAHDTGAFVPVDYQAHGSERRKLDTLLVGSRDLRPVLAAIDEKDVHGLVLIDSCYARNTSRSLHATTPPVYRSLDSGLRARSIGVVSRTDDYPYSRLLTMAASGAKEVAIDLHDPARTLDGKPHGAFTDAVLRALRELPGADANGDAVVTNQEFFADVKLRMAVANIPHSPQMLPSPRGRPPGPGGPSRLPHRIGNPNTPRAPAGDAAERQGGRRLALRSGRCRASRCVGARAADPGSDRPPQRRRVPHPHPVRRRRGQPTNGAGSCQRVAPAALDPRTGVEARAEPECRPSAPLAARRDFRGRRAVGGHRHAGRSQPSPRARHCAQRGLARVVSVA